MEVCSLEELENFVVKEFIRLITSDELSYRGLNPVEYEEQVGENSEFGNYVILTEDIYNRIEELFDVEDYGLTKKDIGRYVYISHSGVEWLMNKEITDANEYGNLYITTESHAKYSLTYYTDDYEGKHINDFVYDCTKAKTLEILNKSKKTIGKKAKGEKQPEK